MAYVQSDSTIGPRLQPEAVTVAHLALHRGEAMGFDTGQNTDALIPRLCALLDNLDQGGIAPKDVLLTDDEWTPETPGAQRVHQLAKASLAMSAT